MTPNFCGSCGSVLQAGNSFCVHCGAPVHRSGPAGAAPAASLPGSTAAQETWPPSPVTSAAQVVPQVAPGYWPVMPYPAVAKKKSLRLALIIVVVVLAVVIGLAAAVYLLAPATAHFASITKTGLNVNGNMTFTVRFQTGGPSISTGKLHLNMRSLENGVQYDAIYFYNSATLSAGSHTWNVDIAVNQNNLGAFSYDFELEVNGTVTDQSTVT